MSTIQKSEAIKNGLRKGFQNDSAKMAKRKCYGYTISSDGEREINPDEAKVVSWIFERYLAGDSLGKNCCWLGKTRYPLHHWQAQMESGSHRQTAFQGVSYPFECCWLKK